MCEDVFSDKNYCLEQIRIAREAFGNKNTTEAQFDALEKCLGLIYLRGPESVMSHAYAALEEAEYRRVHFSLHFWGKKKTVDHA